jgi:hypothetical protein
MFETDNLYFSFLLRKHEKKICNGVAIAGSPTAGSATDADTQVHESDTGPDQIWLDPTIRRNPIGIRVSESLTDLMVESHLLLI